MTSDEKKSINDKYSQELFDLLNDVFGFINSNFFFLFTPC